MKKIAFILIITFAFAAVKAQNNPLQRTISVTGVSELEVTPDEIYVQVELGEYIKKNGDKVDIETIKNNFLSACKNLGLSDTDVVVKGYSGWDGNYWWYQKNKKQQPDLKAGITYWVKVSSTAEMDQLVDKLDDQATQNFSIAKTDYSKREAIIKQMKIDAVRDAKDKAIYLSAAAGAQVGDVITINEPAEARENPQPRPLFMAMAKTADENAPALNVDFKKIKLRFEANIVFAIK